MKLTKELAAVRIARQITDLEQLMSRTLAGAAGLTATMAQAKADTDTDHAVGQDILLRMASVQSELTKASANIARVHGGLLKVARETAYLDEECPKFAIEHREAA